MCGTGEGGSGECSGCCVIDRMLLIVRAGSAEQICQELMAGWWRVTDAGEAVCSPHSGKQEQVHLNTQFVFPGVMGVRYDLG